MSWLYRELPAGCRSVPLESIVAEQARARLAEAARVLGSEEAAFSAARVAGRYELDAETHRMLGLAGVALHANGELPALSPERWAELPAPAPHGGAELGLLLNEAEAQAFTRFLARNHVSDPAPDRAILLARHFFTGEPPLLVIRSSCTS